MSKSNVQSNVSGGAVEREPVLAWINPMFRGRGPQAVAIPYCYTMNLKADLVLKAGDSLFVAQTKSGAFTVKAHRARPEAAAGLAE